MRAYFFDSYALYEIIKGNRAYSEYLKAVFVITTRLNLMEIYHALLKEGEEEEAEEKYSKLLQYCVEITDFVIKKAVRFKLKHATKRLSYVDCIGYMLAEQQGIKFLTGDAAFKEMPNVEFVK